MICNEFLINTIYYGTAVHTKVNETFGSQGLKSLSNGGAADSQLFCNACQAKFFAAFVFSSKDCFF